MCSDCIEEYVLCPNCYKQDSHNKEHLFYREVGHTHTKVKLRKGSNSRESLTKIFKHYSARRSLGWRSYDFEKKRLNDKFEWITYQQVKNLTEWFGEGFYKLENFKESIDDCCLCICSYNRPEWSFLLTLLHFSFLRCFFSEIGLLQTLCV